MTTLTADGTDPPMNAATQRRARARIVTGITSTGAAARKAKQVKLTDLEKALAGSKTARHPMSFATAADRFRGMLKNGPTDLSTREGLGR